MPADFPVLRLPQPLTRTDSSALQLQGSLEIGARGSHSLNRTETTPLPQRQEGELVGGERAKTHFYYTFYDNY